MIYENFGKRLFDIVCSFCGLALLSPFLAVVLLLIKIDSPGPVFFIQKRMGRDFKPFNLIKFRSMTVVQHAQKSQFNPGDESRVTRIGRLLRKTKADELPELFNVLRGDMSIVGPRPEVEKYVRAYPEDFKMILNVRPGLSDHASIKYRDEEAMLANQKDPEHYYLNVILPDKLSLAKRYVEEVSLGRDLHIIRDTLRSIVN